MGKPTPDLDLEEGRLLRVGTRKSDRAVSPFALYASAGVVFAASVAATVQFSLTMAGGMDMPGGWTMSMAWMRMPGQSWPEAAAMFLIMWLAMMVAMMLPSALPMLLSFRRGSSLKADPHPGLSTVVAACGYFGLWTAIGLGVYGAGVVWANMTMRWEWLSKAVPALTGLSLIMVGVFQFTPLKQSRLADCRNSLACRMPAAQAGSRAGLLHGFHYGICCAICCSGLMLSLLVLGVMDLPVMLAVAIVIAAEKVAPDPRLVVRIAGVAAVIGGLAIVVQSLT